MVIYDTRGPPEIRRTILSDECAGPTHRTNSSCEFSAQIRRTVSSHSWGPLESLLEPSRGSRGPSSAVSDGPKKVPRRAQEGSKRAPGVPERAPRGPQESPVWTPVVMRPARSGTAIALELHWKSYEVSLGNQPGASGWTDQSISRQGSHGNLNF